ncbi:hypothetical protein K504DRAFT_467446 [Pleomassaria siparia CBS 279.74]|uniref:Uncharacterized protein n=1 Tax=Pleomassaria siparia CBS 279.74 TaxID=1314801 RepID=A0A6G1K9A4_9PLEO|nr:hypothetical protein K504DRAFT_467446 [Pleomassaria siparia CBS 279.74]
MPPLTTSHHLSPPPPSFSLLLLLFLLLTASTFSPYRLLQAPAFKRPPSSPRRQKGAEKSRNASSHRKFERHSLCIRPSCCPEGTLILVLVIKGGWSVMQGWRGMDEGLCVTSRGNW